MSAWLPKKLPKPPPVDAEFLTQAEAARLLRTTEPTIRYWRKRQWITGAKIGKKVLLKRSDLMAFWERMATA